LKKLQTHALPEFIKDSKGSGLYFFRAGDSIIEIDITIDDEIISVVPYLHYKVELVKKDLKRIMDTDYMLFCLLRKHSLQEK
jgi:hypothetical protein